MVFVTGDTHGAFRFRLKPENFPEGNKMTKEDYVIVLGDFGIWDNGEDENDDLDYLDSLPFTTLFVDGNHENYDILDNLPVSQWHGGNVHFVRPSVIHLMRGQYFDINGATFFAFGGAASHDISNEIFEKDDPDLNEKMRLAEKYNQFHRINHVSWWAREMPSKQEYSEGIENLKKHGNKVDFVLTHSPRSEDVFAIGHGMYNTDELTDYFQKLSNTVDIGYWLFGHMHENIYLRQAACLYEQISQIL